MPQKHKKRTKTTNQKTRTEKQAKSEYIKRMRMIDNDLKSKKLVRVQIPKDGACLFRCVASVLHGTQTLHQKIRTECVDYLEKNKKRYCNFVEGAWQSYIKEMRQPKTWGGEVTIHAMSDLYKANFIIYQYPNAKKAIPEGSPHSKTILLNYANGNHYDVVYEQDHYAVMEMGQALLLTNVFSAAMGLKIKNREYKQHKFQNLGYAAWEQADRAAAMRVAKALQAEERASYAHVLSTTVAKKNKNGAEKPEPASAVEEYAIEDMLTKNKHEAFPSLPGKPVQVKNAPTVDPFAVLPPVQDSDLSFGSFGLEPDAQQSSTRVKTTNQRGVVTELGTINFGTFGSKKSESAQEKNKPKPVANATAGNAKVQARQPKKAAKVVEPNVKEAVPTKQPEKPVRVAETVPKPAQPVSDPSTAVDKPQAAKSVNAQINAEQFDGDIQFGSFNSAPRPKVQQQPPVAKNQAPEAAKVVAAPRTTAQPNEQRNGNARNPQYARQPRVNPQHQAMAGYPPKGMHRANGGVNGYMNNNMHHMDARTNPKGMRYPNQNMGNRNPAGHRQPLPQQFAMGGNEMAGQYAHQQYQRNFTPYYNNGYGQQPANPGYQQHAYAQYGHYYPPQYYNAYPYNPAFMPPQQQPYYPQPQYPVQRHAVYGNYKVDQRGQRLPDQRNSNRMPAKPYVEANREVVKNTKNVPEIRNSS